MNTSESETVTSAATPPEIREEFEAVLEHIRTGKPLAPELERRIRERAERIRQEILENHGLVDIAFPAIREFRDDLPES